MVDLSETGVGRSERYATVFFSDKPRVYHKYVENCGNMVVVKVLKVLCDIVGELKTIGNIACTDLSPIKVKESQGKQLDRIALELGMADGQTVLNYLCDGELFVSLESNKRTWIQPDGQKRKPDRGGKDKRYRKKQKVANAAAAGGNADEKSSEEGSSGTTAPAGELVPPKPPTGTGERMIRRHAAAMKKYHAEVQSTAKTTPAESADSGISEGTPNSPNGDNAAVKKRGGPKRKSDELVGTRQLQRRKKESSDSSPAEQRPQKARKVKIGIRQITRDFKEGLQEVFTKVLPLSQNDRRRPAKTVINKALLLKRVLNCSQGMVIPQRDVIASIPHKVVKKLSKAAVDRFKLKMREPGHFAEAKSRASVSFTKIDKFFKYLLPGEKRVKPGRQTVVNARNAVGDVMQVFNPIEETAGKDGHGHTVDKFFQLLLPSYFDRCARAMFANGDAGVRIVYPEKESTAITTKQQVIQLR